MMANGLENGLIYHYSIGRSGCTLVSQLLAGCIGVERLRAGHERYLVGDEPVFITVRDFRDVVLSFWRVHNDIPFSELTSGRKATRDELDVQLNFVKKSYRDALIPTAKNRRVKVLRYEDFFPDRFEGIFDAIESHLGISIPRKLRKKLAIEFSFKRNKYKSSKMISFKQYDAQMIHGLHLHKGEVGGWQKLLDETLHPYLEQSLISELKEWNYL